MTMTQILLFHQLLNAIVYDDIKDHRIIDGSISLYILPTQWKPSNIFIVQPDSKVSIMLQLSVSFELNVNKACHTKSARYSSLMTHIYNITP